MVILAVITGILAALMIRDCLRDMRGN